MARVVFSSLKNLSSLGEISWKSHRGRHIGRECSITQRLACAFETTGRPKHRAGLSLRAYHDADGK